MSGNEDRQLLIADLCDRFTKIFYDIKQIKCSHQEFDKENTYLSSLINQEIQNHQASISKLQSQILEVQEISKVENQLYTHDSEIEKEINNSDANIENQKIILSLLERKKLEISELNNSKKIRINEFIEGIVTNSAEIEEKTHLIDNIRSNSINLEKKIENLEISSRETQRQFQIFLEEFKKNEKVSKDIVEDRLIQEDESKKTSNEYRKLLNKSSELTKVVQDVEREINGLSEELKIKINRLEVLLRLNSKLSNKLLKLEESAIIEENILEENKKLIHSNQVLREKIEILLSHSLNDHYKFEIKNYLNQINNKNKKYLSINPISNIFKNIVNYIHDDSKYKKKDEIEKIIKQNVYYEEYINDLERTNAKKNEIIFENKKKINNKEESLRNLKEAFFSNIIEKDNISKKSQFLKKKINSEDQKTFI